MAKKQRDTGFIPSLGISEEQRDRLRKRDWTQRQKHIEPHDNWTTAECIEKRFSGIRINRMNGQTEMWMLGEMRISRKTQDVGRNPALLASMHEEAYGTVGTILDIDVSVKRVKVQEKGKK